MNRDPDPNSRSLLHALGILPVSTIDLSAAPDAVVSGVTIEAVSSELDTAASRFPWDEKAAYVTPQGFLRGINLTPMLARRRRLNWAIGCVVTLVATALLPQSAQSYPYLYAQGQVASSGSLGGRPNTSDYQISDVLPFVSSGVSWIDPRIGTNNIGFAMGSASYGRLGAQAESVAFASPPLGFSSPLTGQLTASSIAQWADTVTISALGISTGTLGTLSFALGLNGSLGGQGTETANVTATIPWWSASWSASVVAKTDSNVMRQIGSDGWMMLSSRGDLLGGRIPMDLTGTLPFRFGVPFLFSGDLRTTAQVNLIPGGTQLGTDVQSYANLMHTMEWGGISEVTLANGTPVSGWSLASASGTDL